jgi:hypothetical protein
MDMPISVTAKPNEIESLVLSEINEIESTLDEIKGLLDHSRSNPNRGVHFTLIREFARLSQILTQLSMLKSELSYFYRHNTFEIPYGDE